MFGSRSKKKNDIRDPIFDRWLRNGMRDLSGRERDILMTKNRPNFTDADLRSLQVKNALSSSGDLTQGSVLVPEAMFDQVVQAEMYYGGMVTRGVTYQILTDTGRDMPLPTIDDVANEGAYVAENLASPEQDMPFGAAMLRAHSVTSKPVVVSLQLLQDSAFDIEALLVNLLGTRIGRASNRKFTTGIGGIEPHGVLTSAPTGATSAAGQVNAVLYKDLVNLKQSVDPAYRGRACWMCNDNTLGAIKQLVDGAGRPLWKGGISSSAFLPQADDDGFDVSVPDLIDGNRCVINPVFPDLAAGAKAIAFGDFSKYIVRRVKELWLVRLTERYADKGQVGFIGFARNDGTLVDAGTHPIKLFQNAAA